MEIFEDVLKDLTIKISLAVDSYKDTAFSM